MTHWSQRILLGDYMISEIYYSEQAISEITLALLEDLNWYTVNYYTGGLMKFGKHKGCDFFDKDCVENKLISNSLGLLKSTFPNEFCSSYYTGPSSYGICSSGRQSMSYCLNDRHSQNLESPIYIRNDFAYGYSNKILIEYCPISYDYDAKSTYSSSPLYYGGNCKYGNGNYGSSLKFLKDLKDKRYSSITDILEDEYGGASFCVFSSLIKNNTANLDSSRFIKDVLRPTCYEMRCSEKSLTIKVGSEYFVCPRAGGAIKPSDKSSNYTGVLLCPDYNLICTGTGTVPCNNIFDCVEKNSSAKDSAYTYDYTPSEIILQVRMRLVKLKIPILQK